MDGYQYKAFISYSHSDRHVGRWLHRRLESYRFPRAVRAKRSDLSRLSPVFRDREELSVSHDLSSEIRAALNASERLIVVCSPAAASSHWVDQEVRHFQQEGRAADIFCVIASGDPTSEGSADCFPPALRHPVDAEGLAFDAVVEPLAADLRECADGRRLGLLKLIAGLARIGTDELVQRDLNRSRRRVMAITGLAGSVVLILTALTLIAIKARQEAELRRNDAEGQIEFMLTDLRDKLETVGRIDVLQTVGDRAARYYENFPLSAHDDEALGRRARVFQYLGDIQDRLGNKAESARLFRRAYEATEDLWRRDHTDAERLFNHSQSAFGVGYAYWRAEDTARARQAFEEYLDLVTQYQGVSEKPRLAAVELSNAYANLGVFDGEARDFQKAIANFRASRDVLMDARVEWPKDTEITFLLSDTYGWLASMHMQVGDSDASLRLREGEINLLEQILASEPEDPWESREALASAHRNVARTRLVRGDIQDAIKVGEQAASAFENLTAHDQSNMRWQRGRARTLALLIASYCRATDHESVKNVRIRLGDTLAEMPLADRMEEDELIEELQLEKLKENCHDR